MAMLWKIWVSTNRRLENAHVDALSKLTSSKYSQLEMIDVMFVLVSVRNVSLDFRTTDPLSMHLMYDRVMWEFS